MNTLGHLEKMLFDGEITEEEYKERKTAYIDIVLEMYVKGLIDKEEMQKRINE